MAHPPPPPSPPAPQAPPPPSRAGRLLLAVAGGVALLLLAATLAVYVVFVVVPRQAVETGRQAGHGAVEVAREGAGALIDLGQDLAGRLADGLGVRPRVTVDSQVVSEQTREVLELATVERRLRVQHTYTHTWLGSTKQIRLTGTYLAKAGFDLSEGFEVEVESAPGEEAPRITVRAGEPKLLSIELQDVQVAEDEGLWNRIQPAERQRSLNALQQVARRQAERSGILDAAQQSFERQVQQILLDRLAPTRFELGTEPPPEMRLP